MLKVYVQTSATNEKTPHFIISICRVFTEMSFDLIGLMLKLGPVIDTWLALEFFRETVHFTSMKCSYWLINLKENKKIIDKNGFYTYRVFQNRSSNFGVPAARR